MKVKNILGYALLGGFMMTCGFALGETPTHPNDILPKHAGDRLSVGEMNTIVETLKGIYNSGGEHQIGIGSSPEASLKLGVNGAMGSTDYCDGNGNNCLLIDGGGNYGMGVAGEATSSGEQPLKLDIEGQVGAEKFCDENGNNCIDMGEVQFLPKDCTPGDTVAWGGSGWVCKNRECKLAEEVAEKSGGLASSGEDNWVPAEGIGGGGCASITDERDGKTYPFVRAGSLCWAGRNLDVGVMLEEVSDFPRDNGIIEKWCYGGDPAKCAERGGLYAWGEVMNYKEEGDLCPGNSRMPTAEDLNELELTLAEEGSVCGSELFAGGRQYACYDDKDREPGPIYKALDFRFAGVRGYTVEYKYWGARETIITSEPIIGFFYKTMAMARQGGSKNGGYPIRCVY